MTRRDPEIGDERNASFRPADEVEHSKPGLDYAEGKAGKASRSKVQGHEDSHRLEPSERPKIPGEPLARRIRKPQKGG
jgi:hypothetical protein